jgi:hypothetical protein
VDRVVRLAGSSLQTVRLHSAPSPLSLRAWALGAIAPDSSVAIAAIAPWHEAHRAARAALGDTGASLPAHVAFETTSTVAAHKGTILSANRRAEGVYRAMGVEVGFIDAHA